MQALLLRFLENGEVQRVGASERTRPRRRAHHRGDKSQPRRSCRRRRVPRGSAVPPASDSHPCAAAAGSPRRHPPLLEFFAQPSSTAGAVHRSGHASCCCVTGGPATSANCRTSWSRPSGSPAVPRSGPSIFRRTYASAEGFVHTRERRRRVADDLYEALGGGALLLLGAHPSAVPFERHHEARYSRTGAAWAAGDAWQLSRTRCPLQHAAARLPAVPQFPDRSRLQGGIP